MIIRPLHDRVLVKRLAAEDKTSGGLFIPDTAKESRSRRWLSPWATARSSRAARFIVISQSENGSTVREV